MEDKEAINILTRLLEKKGLDCQEKEAVWTAIGILSWSALGQARIKNMGKAKREKATRVNKLLNR